MKGYTTTIAAAVAAIVFLTVSSTPAAPAKKFAAPNSGSYDQPLSEVFRDFWAWNLAQDNGSDVSMPRGRPLYYLPVLNPQEWVDAEQGKKIAVAEVEVTVAPGVSILASAFACIGETHQSHNGIVGSGELGDTPWAIDWLMPPYGEVSMTLDGKVLVDRNNMGSHSYGPILFQQPIWYRAATDSGATGAVWVEGIGEILPQLKPGKHILIVCSWNKFCPSSGDGRITQYTINVVPPGRK